MVSDSKAGVLHISGVLHGAPATGTIIQALDRGLRSEKLLGHGTTDGHGAFDFVVGTAEAPARPLRGALVVRAVVKDRTIAESAPRFALPATVSLELAVAGARPSDFDVIAKAIAPHLDGIPLTALSAKDLAFLAARTRLDPRRLADFSTAARAAVETKLPAASVYALARAGQPTDPRALVGQPAAVLRSIAGSDAIVGQIRAAAAARLASTDDPFGALLHLAIPDRAEARLALATAIASHEGGLDAFLASRAADPDARRLAHVVELAGIAQSHLPLIVELDRLRASKTIATAKDLASLSTEDWLPLVARAGTPAWIPGVTDAEQRQTFAQILVDETEVRFPTAAVLGRLGRAAADQDLARFAADHPDFDLATQSIVTFPGTLEPATRVRLAAIQRLFQVMPRAVPIRALLDDKIESAFGAVQSGRGYFIERYATAMGGAAVAADFHDAAIERTAWAQAIYGNRATAHGAPAVLWHPSIALPTYQGLFGAFDFCRCVHCRSVYSPAAYLVDILWFLTQQKRVSTPFANAKEVLFARRPDLGKILLTCENTETPFPYVDLVIEILETAVSPRTATSSIATPGTADELSVNPDPAHVNHGAYAVLAAAVFPWDLPLDLDLELARSFLPALGIVRADLMEAFQRRSAAGREPDDATLAAEQLGLTHVQRQLLLGASAHSTAELWGFSSTSATWIQDLAHADQFLRRSGMSYDELLDLAHARFAVPLAVEEPAMGCDPARIAINNLTAPRLATLLRLLRLRHALGWTIPELDAALATFGSTVDDALLGRLAEVQRLRAELRLPLVRVLALWGPLDTFHDRAGAPSPYSQIFANKAVTNPVDVALAAPQVTAAGAPAAPTIRICAVSVCAALGISADDLELLLGRVPDLVRVDHLSALYRHVALARALHLSIADFLRILELSGIDPFVDPAATRRFLDAVAAVRGSELRLRDLDYLLAHRDPDDSVGPRPDAVARTLTDLRGAVRGVASPDEQVAAVAQGLAGALGLDSEVARALVVTHLAHPDDPQRRAIDAFLDAGFVASDPKLAVPPDAPVSRAYLLADKAARLAVALRMTASELPWLFARGGAAGLLDANDLPLAIAEPPRAELFERWRRLDDAFRLRDALPDAFAILDRAAAAPGVLELGRVLAVETGWTLGDVTVLVGPQGLDLAPADFLDERALARLVRCVELVRQMHVEASVALAWTRETVDAAASAAVIRAAKSKLDDAAWLATAKPLRDAVRERQRAALVSYLVHRDRLASSTRLLEAYLVDVETSPCQPTSRIRQAAASVQTFVQRCLLGLEPSVRLDDEAAETWEWKSRYRVWEANRKVFLYPENWIEPELRDDKTPLFEELETRLLQDDLTPDLAADAYATYLEGLEQIARLEIVAAVHESRDHAIGRPDMLHVVGRTAGQPRVYFYRRREGVLWTPWERMDLDLEGDYLIAAIFDRRLYLLWPIFDVKAQPDQSLTDTKTSENQAEIRMAWSTYRESAQSTRKGTHRPGSFSPKRLSTGAPVISKCVSDPDRFTFRTTVGAGGDDVGLVIDCLAIPDPTTITNPTAQELNAPIRETVILSGTFRFHTCRSELVGTTNDPDPDQFNIIVTVPHLPRIDVAQMSFAEIDDHAPGEPLYLSNQRTAPRSGNLEPSGIPPVYTAVLKKTPGPDLFVLRGAIEDGSRLGNDDLFFADASHTMLIVPTDLRAHFDASAAASDSDVAGLALANPHYRFENFEHPLACTFVTTLHRAGIDGLLRWPPDDATTLQLQRHEFFSQYDPNPAVVVQPTPVDEVSFSPLDAYAIYNWELFFHIPFAIACRLTQNQKFADAQRWFHYIFDPTDSTPARDTPNRYWHVAPFYRDPSGVAIEELLFGLDRQPTDLGMRHRVTAFAASIDSWTERPFEPHLIARHRPGAYPKAVVRKYLDNLLAWADNLFRQDSLESIDEAMQLYLTASAILGPRPREIPIQREPAPRSYDDLAKLGLDDFANALVMIENSIPAKPAPARRDPLARIHDRLAPPTRRKLRRTLPPTPSLYFCVPRNEELQAYWDTVDDRLYKIRHCMNLDGVVRRLPQFEPPIDPALLVRAVAAGVPLSSVVSEATRPAPLYRYSALASRAQELANEVKALGGELLSILEKRDAESLARLRSDQETAILRAVREVRKRQVTEATAAYQVAVKAHELATTRHEYYASRIFLNEGEALHLYLMAVATTLTAIGQATAQAAAPLYALPTSGTGGAGIASPIQLVLYGGENGGRAADSTSKGLTIAGGITASLASMSQTLGSYQRRADDWKLQEDLAKLEMAQTDQQVTAADTRRQIAQNELENQELQIDNSRAVGDFLRAKFTNRELFDWMTAQLSAEYFQSYRVAFDLAKQAERAFEFELPDQDAAFIRFGQWDSLKKGLLAGERLSRDLRRMEASYLSNNHREYELTKHVSLALAHPDALVQLKITGRCTFALDEVLFDLDYPGHYLRRFKSVAVSIPCVTGPYGGVNATLTLTGTGGRRTADVTPTELAPISIAIATSTGLNDAGLFETQLRDERYLPFEGQGVVSTWQLSLPVATSSFDTNTISDVVLHVRYTARDGGQPFADTVSAAIRETTPVAGQRLFSARHEFPDDWHRFLFPGDTDTQTLSLRISADRFPYRAGVDARRITSVTFVLVLRPGQAFGDRVPVILTPPSRSPLAGVLEATTTPLGAIPQVAFAVAGVPISNDAPAQWELRIAEADVRRLSPALRTRFGDAGAQHDRLDPAAILDLGILCAFEAELR